jgi:hypothetical protein
LGNWIFWLSVHFSSPENVKQINNIVLCLSLSHGKVECERERLLGSLINE